MKSTSCSSGDINYELSLYCVLHITLIFIKLMFIINGANNSNSCTHAHNKNGSVYSCMHACARISMTAGHACTLYTIDLLRQLAL